MWHPVYRESYSLEALRAAVERPQGGAGPLGRASCDRAPGACRLPRRRPAGHAVQRAAVRAGADAARRTPEPGRRGGAARGARALHPTLGDRARPRANRLPRPRRRAARRGVRNAARLRAARSPPLVHRRGRRRRSCGRLGTPQGDRHFYTPQPIAEYLVRRTLGASGPRRRARIASFSSGSSIRRWEAARFWSPRAAIWRPRTKRRSFGPAAATPVDIGERERAAIRRTVAERCLYGVDLNPMAVQLARLSLWLATLAGDRPLSFLDHRLQVGNSLLGAWLAFLRAAAGAPADAIAARSARHLCCSTTATCATPARGAAGAILARSRCPTTPSSRCARRNGRFAAMNARGSALRTWRRVADLWCASWFATRPGPSRRGVQRAIGRDSHRRRRAASRHARRRICDAAERMSHGTAVLPLGARVSRSVLRGRRDARWRTADSTPCSATRRGT